MVEEEQEQIKRDPFTVIELTFTVAAVHFCARGFLAYMHTDLAQRGATILGYPLKWLEAIPRHIQPGHVSIPLLLAGLVLMVLNSVLWGFILVRAPIWVIDKIRRRCKRPTYR